MLENIGSCWRLWNSSEKNTRTFEYVLIWRQGDTFSGVLFESKYNQTKFSWLFFIFDQLQCEYLSKFHLILTTSNRYFLCSLEAVHFWLPCKYTIHHFKQYASITDTVISMTVYLRKKELMLFNSALFGYTFFTWFLHVLLLQGRNQSSNF